MTFVSLLNKPCIIQRNTRTQNVDGSISLAWTTHLSINTRYHRTSSQKTFELNYKVTEKLYTFYFLPNQDIQEKDRIVVDGRTYQIDGVFQDSSDFHMTVFGHIITLQ